MALTKDLGLDTMGEIAATFAITRVRLFVICLNPSYPTQSRTAAPLSGGHRCLFLLPSKLNVGACCFQAEIAASRRIDNRSPPIRGAGAVHAGQKYKIRALDAG
jgi:hypothetical protein